MPRTNSDIATQIEQDHACLNRDIDDIEREVSREVAKHYFTDWRREFVWRLRDFRNRLLKHFDLEEEGGFMTDILTEKPEAMSQVKQLEKEHEDILANLDEILLDLKAMVIKDSAKLGAIRNRITQMISAIRTHESAENELIQAVYYEEYGYPSAS